MNAHNDQRSRQARRGYAMFEASLGAIGIAWSGQGLTLLELPQADRRATHARLFQRAADAVAEEPPEPIRRLIGELQHYFSGAAVDFAAVAIDLTGVGGFRRQVYEAARSIGWGQTASYGELARRMGAPGAARAVGQALGANAIPIIIPCHRIVASGGGIGGFSAFGGKRVKQRLLALEGVRLGEEGPLLAGLCARR